MELFSRGLEDPGMQEWNLAATLNPRLPGLFVARGKTQLLLIKDAKAAQSEFEKGRQNDGRNPDAYVGLDQSMSLLKLPPHEIAATLKSYPDANATPQGMVYEIALASAEAKEFSQAESAFHGRFFSSGEGDTDVRQIWVEYRVQHALHLAETGKCAESMAEFKGLGDAVSGLDFTEQILPSMTTGTRMEFLAGDAALRCGRQQEADAHFAAAEKSTASDGVYWAAKAAQRMHRYNAPAWKDRLEAARAAATGALGSSNAGYWTYVLALLEREMGDKVAAEKHFEDALRLPDRVLSYHLVRLARAEDSKDSALNDQRVQRNIGKGAGL